MVEYESVTPKNAAIWSDAVIFAAGKTNLFIEK